MIRRDAQLADGSPAWVLISQVDHAQLAGELAEGWSAGDLPHDWAEVIVPTIYRHDDGWREWELAPTIDPASGKPRSFLEMPSDVAYEIWSQSIASVADLGPMAQYIVAEHFCRLRRGADDHSSSFDQKFLAEYGALGERWLQEWHNDDPANHTHTAADAAVGWLQFFDRFSLWLCMAERTKPETLQLPTGGDLSLRPGAHDADGETIGARPWPWPVPQRRLAAAGRLLRVEQFADDDAYQQALDDAPLVRVNWKLTAC